MPLIYTASHSGICARCTKPYIRGEQITHGTGSGKQQVKYHQHCRDNQKLPAPVIAPEVAAVPEPDNVDVWKTLSDGLLPHLADRFTPQINEEAISAEILRIAREEVAKLVIPQNITIKVDTHEIKLEGIKPHKNFADLLFYAANRENIYLYGNPGWGKSEGAFQASKALQLPFGGITLVLQTSDTRLVGYKDATGRYNPTDLRTFYANGGVYLVDEADRASGNTLTALNGTLANGRGFFPDGLVERHKDFICIATGNTTGRGMNPNFPEARPLDEAFRDRFAFIEWEDDHAFERTIAMGINNKSEKWIEWVQKTRTYTKTNGIRLTVSPRATYKGALYLSQGRKPKELADRFVFRGLDVDTTKRIVTNNPFPN